MPDPSEIANRDLLTAIADVEGATAEIEQVELGGYPVVTVVRTREPVGRDGLPSAQLLLGDATADGLGFHWWDVATDDVVAQGAFTVEQVPPSASVAPSYKIAVRAERYLADAELRERVRAAAVRVTRAFVDDQPEQLADIPHVQNG